MRPFLVLFALTVLGLAVGLFSRRFETSGAGEGQVVTLFWTTYDLLVLGLTIPVCVELPRRDRHVVDRPERATVPSGRGEARVWVSGLTLAGPRLRGLEAPAGTELLIVLPGVGEVPATAILCQPGNTMVRVEVDGAIRDRLLERLHATGGVANVVRPRVFGMVGDLLVRLGTGRARRSGSHNSVLPARDTAPRSPRALSLAQHPGVAAAAPRRTTMISYAGHARLPSFGTSALAIFAVVGIGAAYLLASTVAEFAIGRASHPACRRGATD